MRLKTDRNVRPTRLCLHPIDKFNGTVTAKGVFENSVAGCSPTDSESPQIGFAPILGCPQCLHEEPDFNPDPITFRESDTRFIRPTILEIIGHLTDNCGHMIRIFSLALVISVLAPVVALAELSVPHFFSDHMVLQRNASVSIWGKAEPGAEVSVAFKGASTLFKANAKGNWKGRVLTGKADAQGSTLKIATMGKKILIKDVLVGEVWFASGQSNMVFPMGRVPAYEELMSKANFPLIRFFNAPTVTAVEPQDDIEGEWTLCSSQTVPGYSAVAFFFARKLQQELGIPIGVIKSAWGGKPVETFTSRKALNTLPGTKTLVEAAVYADANYDPAKAKATYESRLENWQAAIKAWNEKPASERKRRPRKPAVPKRPLDTEGKPGVLFNSMINPFVGYSIQGAIWYQGEGNAKAGAVPYDQTLPLLINDWRSRWQADFSFYYVQLANYRIPSTEPGNNDPWPLLQDRMRLVLETTPKTGMAIINDVGEAKDIHPKNKHDVGERLALWALAKDYGKDIVYSGPLYRSSKVRPGAVQVTFEQSGTGLKSRDGGALKRFEIAGQDKIWHWADAKVTSKDTVTVSSKKVRKPVAVRYAWAANPEGANLVNSLGLPASVFRTDGWNDAVVQVDTKAQKALEERRALAVEIKALAAQKAKLARGSDEFAAVLKKQQALLKKYRETAPAPKK
jgi:sialate O-acetylesterase